MPELVDTRRLPRVLALEEHAHLTITQLMRVKRSIALEEQFQMPVPETRSNVALANELLQAQFRMAQEMGLEPKRGSMAPAGGGEPAGGAVEELARRIVELPSEQFLPLLHNMFRKQYELHKDQAPRAFQPVIDVRARRVEPENGTAAE